MPVSVNSTLLSEDQRGTQSSTPNEPLSVPLEPTTVPSHLNKDELPMEVDMTVVLPDTRTFHQFRKLPAEIRLKIWKLASNEPRLVELDLNYSTGLWIQTSPPPGVLAVCSESRFEGLKYYKLSLAKVGGRTLRSDNRVFLNFHHDIVLFEEKSLLHRSMRPKCETPDHQQKSYVSQIMQFSKYTRDSERAMIRRISIVFSVCVVPGFGIQFVNIKGIHKYPALEELIIIRQATMFTGAMHNVSVAKAHVHDQLKRIKRTHPTWKVPEVKFVNSATHNFRIEDVCGKE